MELPNGWFIIYNGKIPLKWMVWGFPLFYFRKAPLVYGIIWLGESCLQRLVFGNEGQSGKADLAAARSLTGPEKIEIGYHA